MEIDHAEIAKRLLTEQETTIKLEHLVGEYELSGVSMDSTKHKDEWDEHYEDCSIISFVLDDITFTALEDPQDGYRSSMRHVLVEKFNVENRFQPIKVYTKYRENNKHEADYDKWMSPEDCSILEFYDRENDECILRVGTGNTNDYYPYFVSDWRPGNMAINK